MKYKYQEGFTLLELLVSLSILSLLSILIINGIHTGVIGSQKISKKLDSIETFENLDRLFRREISSLIPIETSYEDTAKVYFSGDKNGIKFMAQSEYGPKRYAILSDNKNTIRFADGLLQKTSTAYQIGPHHFKFFGALAGEPEARWHQKWENQTNTPQLVRLTIDNYLPITARPPKYIQPR